MEKEVKIATLVDEDGVEYELEVVKEFDYNDKKYAVLYEEDECECDDECDCEDNCDEECACEDDCDCGCGGHIYVFEVAKDENGKEVYSEIDPSLMDEIIPVVEKELYPTE